MTNKNEPNDIITESPQTDKQSQLDIWRTRANNFDVLYPDVEKRILELMDAVRIKNNITLEELCSLINFASPANYSRAVRSTHHIPRVDSLLRFCYIFGYDFETALSSPAYSAQNDWVVTEIGAQFSSMSDETLLQMCDFLNDNTNETRYKKMFFRKAVKALIETRKEFQNFVESDKDSQTDYSEDCDDVVLPPPKGTKTKKQEE